MANLMAGGQKKTQETVAREQDTLKKFSELSERTRLLEERIKQSFQKIQVIDETNTHKIKDLKEKMTNIDSQLSSIRKDFDEIKEVIRRIAKDMSQTAKLSDVRVLEKYINMVDITRLVTEEDVIRIVEERLKSKNKKG